MLRRKKKKDESAPAEDGQAVAADAAPGGVESGATDETETLEPVAAGAGIGIPADGEDEHEPGHAAIAFAEAPAPAPVEEAPDLDELVPAPAEIKQRYPRYQPADVPLATPYGAEEHLSVGFVVGSVQDVLSKSGTASAEEREREAAAEFQAAIMPGLMGLRDAVPDAASPDDALRALAEQEAQHEFPEDSEGSSLSRRDIFQSDSAVYYRIRTRFEKPRRRVGWGDPWRPPPGLARPDPPSRAVNRPD